MQNTRNTLKNLFDIILKFDCCLILNKSFVNLQLTFFCYFFKTDAVVMEEVLFI